MTSESLVGHANSGDSRAWGGKYLTFSLAGEQYGLEILKVREIIGITAITTVPQMPAHVRGVINLRGKVIPVVDLRLRFGLPREEYTDATCIIVADVGTLVGIIVDAVQEVLNIDGDQVDPPPPLGASVDTTFILGMGKFKEGVKILLDIDKILNEEETFAAEES